jgi:site-specific DNA recombinase
LSKLGPRGPDGLEVALRLPIPNDGRGDGAAANEAVLSRFVPMRMKRRGVEMRLVIDGGAPSASRVDLPLLKAVARAHRWSNDLISGEARSIGGIARCERVTARYLRRGMRLAFLSPGIVEAIAEGRQPVDLTALALLERIDLPPFWSAQEQALGIR